MKELDYDNIAFVVTTDEIQHESVRLLGRKLDDDELDIARKCIYNGLASGIYIVFQAAIDEAVTVNN